MKDLLDNETQIKPLIPIKQTGLFVMVVLVAIIGVLCWRAYNAFMFGNLYPSSFMTTDEDWDKLWPIRTALDNSLTFLLVTCLLVAFLFYTWVQSAYQNLERTNQVNSNISSRFAAASFFIPVANFYFMPQVINHLLKGTNQLKDNGENEKKNSWPGFIFTLLWATGLILFLFFGDFGLMRGNDPEVHVPGDFFKVIARVKNTMLMEIVACCIWMVTAVFLIYIIQKVTRLQSEYSKQIAGKNT